MKNVWKPFMRAMACLCLVSSSVANDRIQEENAELAKAMDFGRLSELNDLDPFKRVEAVHALFLQVDETRLREVVEALVLAERGRAESEMLRLGLLKLSLLGDYEWINGVIDRLDEDIVDQCWYRLGWEMADMDPDKSIEFLNWLNRESVYDSEYAEGVVYSMKSYNMQKLVEHFDVLAYYDAAAEALEKYLIALSASDLSAAWEMLVRYEDDLDWELVLEGIVDGLVERDLDRALEFSLNMEDSYDREYCLARVLKVLAKTDGGSATALLERLCEADPELLGEVRSDLAKELVGSWFSSNPSACLEWVLDHETRGVRRALLGHIGFWSLDPDKFEEVANTILNDVRIDLGSGVTNHFIDSWIAKDAKSFARWAAKGESSDWLSGLPQYRLSELVRKVPEFVEDLVHTLPKGEKRRELSGMIANNWDKSDMSGFLDWVSSVGDEDSMEGAMYSFFKGTRLSHDLSSEIGFVESLPEGRVQDMYRERLVDQFSFEEFDQAANLALEIGDAGLRANVIRRIAGNLATRDPDSALLHAKENSDLHDTNFMQAVLSIIADNNPEKAYENLGYVSNSEQMSEVASKVFGSIFDEDEDYAIGLLEGDPNPISRDAGWKALAKRVENVDPEEALTYAMKVEDSELRRAQLKDSYTTFVNRYPEKAIQWLEEAPIAEQEFNELLSIRSEVVVSETEEVFELRPFHFGDYHETGGSRGVW